MKIAIIFSVVSLCFISCVFCQHPEDDFYMKGVQLAASGRLEEAEKDFTEALNMNPFLFYAASARQIAQDGISGRIKRTSAVSIFKGISFGNKEAYEIAIANLDRAIEAEPGYGFAYNERGVLYDMSGKHDKALRDFTLAIEKSPNQAYAYNNRGYVYAGMGVYDEALADFDKAVELNPSYSIAYYNRGCIYGSQMGMYEKAISSFIRAIEINPEYDSAYLDRGICYMMQKNYASAVADIDKALEINPRNGRALWHRALCLDASGKKDDAIAAYRAVIQNSPSGSGYIAESENRIKILTMKTMPVAFAAAPSVSLNEPATVGEPQMTSFGSASEKAIETPAEEPAEHPRAIRGLSLPQAEVYQDSRAGKG